MNLRWRKFCLQMVDQRLGFQQIFIYALALIFSLLVGIYMAGLLVVALVIMFVVCLVIWIYIRRGQQMFMQ